MISKYLNAEEYDLYYKTYTDKSSDINILKGLQHNLKEVIDFFSKIPKSKHDFAYESGKWTIKQVLLHIIDTERIFSYRALRIARSDKTPLAGFNQDEYANTYDIKERSMKSLINEYELVRKTTIALYESFTKADLIKIGTASGSNISVRAIGYILTGHENHHILVIKSRYF